MNGKKPYLMLVVLVSIVMITASVSADVASKSFADDTRSSKESSSVNLVGSEAVKESSTVDTKTSDSGGCPCSNGVSSDVKESSSSAVEDASEGTSGDSEVSSESSDTSSVGTTDTSVNSNDDGSVSSFSTVTESSTVISISDTSQTTSGSSSFSSILGTIVSLISGGGSNVGLLGGGGSGGPGVAPQGKDDDYDFGPDGGDGGGHSDDDGDDDDDDDDDDDTTPPQPDPSTWDSNPSPSAVSGLNSIIMSATLATDPSGGVEYYFEETSGNPGGSDSGWQVGRQYIDTELRPNTRYTYKVRTRDALNNMGCWSSSKSATTDDNQPVAIISYPDDGEEFEVGKQITFRADGSYDPDEGDYIVEYEWHFWRESYIYDPIITTENSISRVFEYAKEHGVQLKVLSDKGLWSSGTDISFKIKRPTRIVVEDTNIVTNKTFSVEVQAYGWDGVTSGPHNWDWSTWEKKTTVYIASDDNLYMDTYPPGYQGIFNLKAPPSAGEYRIVAAPWETYVKSSITFITVGAGEDESPSVESASEASSIASNKIVNANNQFSSFLTLSSNIALFQNRLNLILSNSNDNYPFLGSSSSGYSSSGSSSSGSISPSSQDSDSICVSVHVSGIEEVGSQVTLEGSASGGTSPYDYLWDFNDDGTYEKQGETVHKTWYSDGNKNVKCKSIDSSGEYSITTKNVYISPSSCSSSSPSSGSNDSSPSSQGSSNS